MGTPLREVIEASLLVGYERFAGVLDGGVDAWLAGGRDVQRVASLETAEAERSIGAGAIAIDVREPSEVLEGKVPGALEIPLGQLQDRLGEVPEGRPLVAYCAAGNRSSTAISLLERAGRGPLVNLRGGFDAWRRKRP